MEKGHGTRPQRLRLEFGGLQPLPPSNSPSLRSPSAIAVPCCLEPCSSTSSGRGKAQLWGISAPWCCRAGGRLVSESSGPKHGELVQGCAWSLPLGTVQRKPTPQSDYLVVVVDICLQRLSCFEFIFLKSHSILPFLLCSAAQIHLGETTTLPG